MATEEVAQALGFLLGAAAAVSAFECRSELGQRQPRGSARGGCGGQDRSGLGSDQAMLLGLERLRGCRVVVAQQRADLVNQLLAGPDRVLLGAGTTTRGRTCSVGRQRPVCRGVAAHDVGQDQSVAGIGLGAGEAVPVAVACGGQRVGRVHLPGAGA